MFIALLFAATLLSGNQWGTLLNTLFYVVVGCSIQFVIGLMLAFLCSQPVTARISSGSCSSSPYDNPTRGGLCLQDDST